MALDVLTLNLAIVSLCETVSQFPNDPEGYFNSGLQTALGAFYLSGLVGSPPPFAKLSLIKAPDPYLPEGASEQEKKKEVDLATCLHSLTERMFELKDASVANTFLSEGYVNCISSHTEVKLYSGGSPSEDNKSSFKSRLTAALGALSGASTSLEFATCISSTLSLYLLCQ